MFRVICNKFYRILLVLLFILLCFCVYASIFYIGGEASLEKYSPFILLTGISALIFGWIAFYQFLEKCSLRELRIIGFALFVLLAIALCIFGFGLKYIPPYDLIHVRAEAINMLETGKIVNVDYFAKYPNQQPMTLLLYFVFTLSKWAGIEAYNTIGIILNICCILLSAYFTFKICCFRSLKTGVIGLSFFALDPLLYTWASYYYSDTLCMPFMLGGILLFLYAEKKRKLLLFLFSAFVLMLGGKIRITVAFAIIAIIIYILIKYPIRVFLKKFCLILVGVLCAIFLSNALLNEYGIQDKSIEYPITHWLKLGLNEESYGSYTSEDERTTMSEPTYEAKIQENLNTIEERIHELGADGLIKLSSKKIARTWATSAYTELLQNTVENYNTLYKYTIGRGSIAFNYCAQIIRCVMLIIISFGTVCAIKEKKYQNAWIYILLFGAIIFYIFWEAKPKYSLCFLPILYILATYSLKCVKRVYDLTYIKIKLRHSDEYYLAMNSFKKIIKKVFIFIVMYSIIIGSLACYKYVIKEEPQKDLRVNQTVSSWRGRIDEIGIEGVEQSFISRGNFNTIEIKFLNPDKLSDQKYVLKILNKDHEILQEQYFSSNDIIDNEFYTFKFSKVLANSDKFYLTIQPLQEYEKYLGVNTALYSMYTNYNHSVDYYPDGALYLEREENNSDLTFIVSNQYKGRTFSIKSFIVIFSITLFAEIIIGIWLYKNKEQEEEYK